MSKDAPKDDPKEVRSRSYRQTDKPWKGNPEKEQRHDDAKFNLEKLAGTKTH
jgi:hypothetical protein